MLRSARTFVALVALVAASSVDAADPTTAPSLLEQLSRETQQAYQHAQSSLVRVQFPRAVFLNQLNSLNNQIAERENLLHKWEAQLDPQVRQQLIAEQQQAVRRVGAVATSQPGNVPATQPIKQLSPGVTVVPAPENIIYLAAAILIDAQGHAVAPMFVDPAAVANATLRVQTFAGRMVSARLIGSDRLTNISVLQLDTADISPVGLAASAPGDGELELAVAPDGAARLVVWTNAHPEQGFILNPDGDIAGFSFNGQFLAAPAARHIIDQILATGQVHRAQLGIKVKELSRDDPQRAAASLPASTPAMMVVEVLHNSAADQAGLQANDLILSVAGQSVQDRSTFAAIIATRTGPTELRLLRAGSPVAITVNLTSR